MQIYSLNRLQITLDNLLYTHPKYGQYAITNTKYGDVKKLYFPGLVIVLAHHQTVSNVIVLLYCDKVSYRQPYCHIVT